MSTDETDISPLVSVVIPAIRRADFVNQAVASVLRQTFTDYEIIVVDDGSGEDTLRQYQLPPSVRLIARPENSGRASIPRNEGYRVSRGKYLAFLDMDDIWLPEKLAAQVATLETHPEIGVTFCHATLVDESLRPLLFQRTPPRLNEDILRQILWTCFIHSPSLALIRREALEAEGAFDEEIIGTSDWDLWLRLARSARFHADPTPFVLYRCHPGQVSHSRFVCKRGRIQVLEKTRRWLAERRPDLLPLLRRQLARYYNSLAKGQIDAGEDASAVLRSVQAAFANNPLSPRTYLEFIRLACYAALQRRRAPAHESDEKQLGKGL